MPKIILNNVTKRFGKFVAVDKLNLVIEDRSFITLLGPSGCGKTTTLRMIAGLETPTEGEIIINDKIVFSSEKGIDISPSKRDVGFLFQNYALWPHMTVTKNISFGLENLKWPKDKIEARVQDLLKMLKIEEFASRYPAELSGGQQQRVAIARTLAPEPSVLFMDEPLSNLDAKLRLEMRYELQRLHVETGSTFVYVTHDQMEAMTLATSICLINNGLLQQYDAPLDVYNKPNNLFVADFVGNPSINFVETHGKEVKEGLELALFSNRKAIFKPVTPISINDWYSKRNADKKVTDAEKEEALNAKGYVEKSNKDEVFRYHIAKIDEDEITEYSKSEDWNFVLGIRPECLDIIDKAELEAEIYGAMPTGMESTIKVKIDDFLLTGEIFGNLNFKIGSKVNLTIISDRIMLFDRVSGKLITTGSLEFV